jgi:predicted amidohydrolase
MRLALSQFGAELGQVSLNRRRISEWLDAAAAAGADLACFPELAVSGYLLCPHDYADALLAAVDQAERQIAADGRRLGLTVVYGTPRRGPDGRLRNAVVLAAPDGTRLVYDKTHMVASERRAFAPGDDLVVGEGGIGLACCYDLAFPEAMRTLALRGARLLVVPMAWEVERAFVMRRVLAARAVENVAFVAVVNQTGKIGDLRFAGGTCVVDPLGETVASAGEGEDLVVADVDLGWVDRLRRREDPRTYPLLADRRPALYASVAAGPCPAGADRVLSQTFITAAGPARAETPVMTMHPQEERHVG